jgi:hypothetical protein
MRMRGIAESEDGFGVVLALLNAVAPEFSKLDLRKPRNHLAANPTPKRKSKSSVVSLK